MKMGCVTSRNRLSSTPIVVRRSSENEQENVKYSNLVEQTSDLFIFDGQGYPSNVNSDVMLSYSSRLKETNEQGFSVRKSETKSLNSEK